jgi:hypothetical protein
MRTPFTDVLHRGTVLVCQGTSSTVLSILTPSQLWQSLVGLTGYGIFLSLTVHQETLEKGKGVSQ